jgi:hypothetical protein
MEELHSSFTLKGDNCMSKKTRKAACIFVSLLMLSLTFVSSTFCQQLTIKQQKDGSIKIESTPKKVKARIANMVYCRTIDELIKEEKNTLSKLISDNRYGELKDSIEIIEGLQALRAQKCK